MAHRIWLPSNEEALSAEMARLPPGKPEGV
jgi:hypothetical protein